MPAMPPPGKLWIVLVAAGAVCVVAVGFVFLAQAGGAALQDASQQRLRALTLGAMEYEDARKSLPPAFLAKDDQPLLSWRVAILPFIGQDKLFQEFKQDQPWDSPVNQKLIAKMPAAFASPYAAAAAAQGKTTYLAVRGEKTAIRGAKGVSIAAVRDGLSVTLLFVEVDPEHAVEWTRPSEWEVDPSPPLDRLHKVGGRFLGVFGDGKARSLPLDMPAETLLRLIDCNDGKAVNMPK